MEHRGTLRIYGWVPFSWNGKQSAKAVTVYQENDLTYEQAREIVRDFHGENHNNKHNFSAEWKVRHIL